MILIFALAGTFTAMIAGVSALVMGQPWWIGLASYVAAGIITVCFLAVFSAFSTKAGIPRHLRHAACASHIAECEEQVIEVSQ